MAALTPELVISSDLPTLHARAADAIEARASRSIQARKSFRIALSGGSTPRGLYELLASRERAERIDWRSWEIFFGDERAVPPDHEHSNFRMANEAWLSRVPLPADRVHRMPGELGAEAGARAYEAVLGELPLDLVLLGMGDDGHTASLFPGDRALLERERRVVAGRAPSPPHDRITLGFRALGEAREAMFLITGERKAELVARVVRDLGSETAEVVAARVRPRDRVTLHLDRSAAKALDESSC